MSRQINAQDLEETRAYLKTLNREELCEFMIAESQNLLDELDQAAKKVEQTNSASMPLLAVTKKEVENVLGEEYLKMLYELKKS